MSNIIEDKVQLEKFAEDKKLKMNEDKSFQAPVDANALCAQFNEVNGAYATPEAFVRAYLKKDKRVLNSLKVKNFDAMKKKLDAIYPEIKEYLSDGVINPDEIRDIMKQVRGKYKPAKK